MTIISRGVVCEFVCTYTYLRVVCVCVCHVVCVCVVCVCRKAVCVSVERACDVCVCECACVLGNICTYVPYLRIPWAVRNLKGQCLQSKYRKKNSV